MEKIQELYERFYVFIGSSFGENERCRLFQFIWSQYHQKIAFYISNLIPYSHPGFDDIFQEVMIKIYKNLNTFNPLHSFKAWIYRIARNHCIDFLKSKKENFFKPNEIEIEKIVDLRTPEKIAVEREMVEKIDNWLAQLNETDREISYLRFFENMTYRDIGRTVNINPNTVKSRLQLIKKNLNSDLNS
jgi:RNA polymerase sigma-70 factor (ECF subfamily)